MDQNVEKVYSNETISDVPFPANPDAQTVTDTAGIAATGTNPSKNTTIPQQNFPTKQIAVEVISTALNTTTKKIIQEFAFTPSGAIQIGEFEAGVSGDVRISPDGIVARNRLGDTTFALDADTGDAIFAGQLRTGTVVAGVVYVGSSSNIVIDGDNERIVIFDSSGVARVLLGFLAGGF